MFALVKQYDKDFHPKEASKVVDENGEPLAIGLHACSTGGVKLGQTVAIVGAGCIGLVTLLTETAAAGQPVRDARHKNAARASLQYTAHVTLPRREQTSFLNRQ
ncbi:MAG: hypothetical protein K5841_03730 [Fretibacterium sp.]|nr:hypothetical protein [Fretibacterium sp.]